MRCHLLVLSLGLVLATQGNAQSVTNVRAQQLSDGTKRVEVLYDLTGVAVGGATVTIVFSDDAGATYSIHPVAATLSGDIGAGVASGTNRRILWDARASLPSGTYGTNYRTAVTATTVPGQAPQIAYFTATPSIISPGGSATLSWSSTGATTALINNGLVATTGTLSVSPSATTTYTLTVSSPGGTDTRQVTVTVTGLPSDCNVAFTSDTPTQTARSGDYLVLYRVTASATTQPGGCLYHMILPTIYDGYRRIIYPASIGPVPIINSAVPSNPAGLVFKLAAPPAGTYSLDIYITGTAISPPASFINKHLFLSLTITP